MLGQGDHHSVDVAVPEGRILEVASGPLLKRFALVGVGRNAIDRNDVVYEHQARRTHPKRVDQVTVCLLEGMQAIQKHHIESLPGVEGCEELVRRALPDRHSLWKSIGPEVGVRLHPPPFGGADLLKCPPHVDADLQVAALAREGGQEGVDASG